VDDFILRKWDIKDAPDIARYANNKNIADNLRDAFAYPYTLKDAGKYISSCLAEDEAKKLSRAIVIKGKAAGSISISVQSDIYRKSAELGYWLAQQYWGRGIMSAAVKQITREAFEKLDIIRIYAQPFAHNKASCKVLQHSGFELEGIMKSSVIKNGQIYDSCMYALIKR